MEKEWGNTYSFKDAKVTACDGDVPAWSFEADEGKVTIDGKARLKGARFNIKNTPVLYTPFFSMSMAKRESGLLMPGVGYSSRLGATVNVPIYIAINEENDMTLYENVMSARGLMQGVEYRHNLDAWKAKGYWRFDYLNDAQVISSEADEKAPFDYDGLIRTNHDRFWLRSKFDAEIPGPELKVKLDLDYVSDQNYLREFKSGLSGYQKSKETFLDQFSRGIEENDQNRLSTALVTRDFERGALNAKAQYLQDPSYGHGNASQSTDPTVQTMPEFSGYLYKDRIPGMESVPLEFAADVNAANFWRNYGTTGSRYDIHPSVSIPLNGSYGYLISSAGFRETLYAIGKHQPLDGYQEDSSDLQSRELFNINALAGSEAWKVYDFGTQSLALTQDNLDESQWTKVKHSIQPRVQYNYIPYVRQRLRPYFDTKDRVSEVNELTYSLTNVASRKRETVIMRAEDADDPQMGLKTDYLDFVRLRLQQTYDMVEAARTSETAEYDVRPFSDLLGDLTLRLTPNLSLTNKTWLSPYLLEITEHSHMLNLQVPDWFMTSFGFDFQQDVNEYNRPDRPNLSILNAGAGVFLFSGLSVGVGYKTDIANNRDLESSVALSYRHQCFDIMLAGATTPIEDCVEAWVNLVGLNIF